MAYRYVSTRSDWFIVCRWLEGKGIRRVVFDDTFDPVCPYYLDVNMDEHSAELHIHDRYCGNPLGSFYLKMALADWAHCICRSRNMKHDLEWWKCFLSLLLFPIDMKV